MNALGIADAVRDSVRLGCDHTWAIGLHQSWNWDDRLRPTVWQSATDASGPDLDDFQRMVFLTKYRNHDRPK